MPVVDYRIEQRVAIVTFANPPVNGLSHAVRVGIAEALARAASDPAVAAVVLTGAGRFFSAGADIAEFGTAASRAEPALPRLTAIVESSPKPVVAAIAGTCLGGGLEIALAAQYRVASGEAKLGMPEVKLGLIPGAGGTQRLPRLAGPERAIEMITSGEPEAAASLAGTGLIDRIAHDDPQLEALELAAAVGSQKAPLRRTRDLTLDRALLTRACEAARERLKAVRPRLPAPLRALDAIEAAAGSFEEGLALERRAFLDLLETPESRGLRHAFVAERAAGKVDGISAATPVRPVEQAVVIGGGTMGSGIAAALLDAGIPVWLLEADQAALDRGIARIAGIHDAQVKRGRLSPAERDHRRLLLRPTLAYAAVAQADLAIEAVFESLDVKRDVFLALDQVMKPGAILATNTSSLDLNTLAGFTRRPVDVIGLHFFSPANVMRLLEIVRGRETGLDVLATALGLAKSLRKVAVVSGVCDGFIGNRMLDAYVRQAWYLLEEGATPEEIDQTIEAFGFAMGPFRVADLVGLDVSYAIRRRRGQERPDYRYSSLPDQLCESGRLGQKTGAGWYDYPDGPRRPVPSAAVSALIGSHRTKIGLAGRRIDSSEIVDRLIYALVNEGARLLDEGIAARPGDIDVVYVAGYGFPRWRGGPLFYAGELGWDRVLQRVRQFERTAWGDPAFWTPAPLIERLAARGPENQLRRRLE
jgi:3-hydroxyacyl-CoA dehydrogenase